MGVILHKEPELNNPDILIGWPGIGNIGLIAVDTIRQAVQAEELGEIEPYDFFYPNKVILRGSILSEMEFPTSKFYYKRLVNRDLLFFIGEEQPATRDTVYAEGERAYEMANLVLDTALRFNCRRVYTYGAAVAIAHHTAPPKVWGIANQPALLKEIRGYPNTIMMSEAEGRGNEGSITGLNGLMIGVAKRRGIPGICLMGEIPDYLARVPVPYPKAAQSLIDVVSSVFNLNIKNGILSDMVSQMGNVVENVYAQFPADIRERLDQRKIAARRQPESITEEDQAWLKDHIDDFFKKGDKNA
ncbi:MAG: PAC2 family protein [Dehalococcoidales bacterium]|nr:PAC2 family protein [Dehalococcoidales bacterium]